MNDYVGAAIDSYRVTASHAVRSKAHQAPSPVYGYLRKDLHQKIYLFQTIDEGRDWITALVHAPDQPPYDYAAVFTAMDLSQPVLDSLSPTAATVGGDAQVGRGSRGSAPAAPGGGGSPKGWKWVPGHRGGAADHLVPISGQTVDMPWYDPSADASVGSAWPLLLGLPLGAAAGYFYRGWKDEHPDQWIPGLPASADAKPVGFVDAMRRTAAQVKAAGDPYVGGPWVDFVGNCPSSVGGPWVDLVGHCPSVGGPWVDLVGGGRGGGRGRRRRSYGGGGGGGGDSDAMDPGGDDDTASVGGPWVDIVGGYTVGGPWVELVGADPVERSLRVRQWPQIKALIQSAINEVSALATSQPAEAYVWSLDPPGTSPRSNVTLEGTTSISMFNSHDEALDFMRSRIQTPHVALALFDRRSPHWPNPVNWTKSNDPAYEPVIASQAAKAGMRVSGDYVGADAAIGAAIDDVRGRAQSMANKRAGNVVGVIHTTRDNLWHALSFRDEDAADDWLTTATQDPGGYTYAAYYDKGDATWPNAVIEKIGGTATPALRRGRGTSHDWAGNW